MFFLCVLVCVSEHVCFLLLVTWEESLDLLDDGLVAGVPFGLASLTPVSDKLLYGGLELVHVKRRGWAHLPRILPLAILNVLKHVDAVVDDGLQHLLVVVCTLADAGQVGLNSRQQILVALG